MFTQVWTKSQFKNTRPYVSCKHANTIKFPADQVRRKAESKNRFWVFALSNVYISLNQTQNTVKKNTKSYVSCKHKHASTIEFPADQACLGKQKIRRAVHRQQQVCMYAYDVLLGVQQPCQQIGITRCCKRVKTILAGPHLNDEQCLIEMDSIYFSHEAKIYQ